MKELLMGKASGTVTAIDKMDAEQRAIPPSLTFGEDYNVLRKLTLEHFPQVQTLLPPEVGPREGWPRLSDASYGEIRTYAEQIFQILGGLTE